MNPYLLALFSNISFSLGSMFFTHYTKRFSSIWMNTVKAGFATLFFFIVILATGGFQTISLYNFSVFFVSGFLALGIGDLFLLNAFSRIGAGRTLLLFGFQPLIIGFLSFLFFSQGIPHRKLIAIIFFIICLLIFSFEGKKRSGSWEVKGLLFAFIGMVIDAVGIIITRYAFNLSDNLSAFEGNFHRCLGALVAYMLLSHFFPINLVSNFKKMKRRSLGLVILGSFLGTFLSLACYLEAIKTGHLATISAISITCVVFASSFESIWHKVWPSKYLLGAFFFFLIGMWFLLN